MKKYECIYEPSKKVLRYKKYKNPKKCFSELAKPNRIKNRKNDTSLRPKTNQKYIELDTTG